jgi:hypothetical protein
MVFAYVAANDIAANQAPAGSNTGWTPELSREAIP